MNLSSENFLEAFHSLTHLLTEHRSLWSESAFVNDNLAWFAEYPRLHSKLLALTDEELAAWTDETALMVHLSAHIPHLKTLADWRISPETGPRWQTPKLALFGLPERKRLQTEGFVTSLGPLLGRTEVDVAQGARVVDWCSGRGLLARQLYYASGNPVLCLERDAERCRSGQLSHATMDPAMAAQVSFQVQDVLQPIAAEQLENAYLHTALHACGDLHRAMLITAVQAQARVIACSPCCFHLMQSEVDSGLSQQGRQSALRPTRDQLRLATAETTTANASERVQRQLELLWRVAFDLHLRDLSGVDEYCPTPSIKKSQLKGSFIEYVRWMMTTVQSRGVRAVSFVDLNQHEQAALLTRAKRKLAVLRRLEKAQLGFRKALEYWLLLDRALFLREHGYHVKLREFCHKHDSGRNTVIVGSLASTNP